MEGMKIVLDVANGATYKVAPEAFFELGAHVEVIHNTPDGLNINDGCGSQHTEDLRRKVKESGAALGLAFDGDGDRLIAVDEKGNEITGDQILLICALMFKEQGKLKNDFCEYRHEQSRPENGVQEVWDSDTTPQKWETVMCSRTWYASGVVGGEDSGHMLFLDHHTTGDGIVTAMQVIGAMVKSGKPLSELAAMMDIFPQADQRQREAETGDQRRA